jgi:hypothetical protein
MRITIALAILSQGLGNVNHGFWRKTLDTALFTGSEDRRFCHRLGIEIRQYLGRAFQRKSDSE